MRVLLLGTVMACTPPTSSVGSPAPPEVLGVGFMDTADSDVVQGEVTTLRREERYLLRGRTAADLVADLEQRRPRDERFTGWTRWKMKWRFEPNLSGGTCAVAVVDVDLELTTVLPAWEPPVDADPALVAAWDGYLRALEAHEAVHGALARSAADRVHQALSALPGQDDCDRMRDLVNLTGQSEVQRLRLENSAFDTHTEHGASQGAIFPGPDRLAGMP